MQVLLHTTLNGIEPDTITTCRDLGISEDDARRYHRRGMLSLVVSFEESLEEDTLDPLPEEE